MSVRGVFSVRRSQNATGRAQKCLFFFANFGRKTAQTVKTTAEAKNYGFGRRTIFSTEGSFGFRSAQNRALGKGQPNRPSLKALVDSVSVRFKHARVDKIPLPPPQKKLTQTQTKRVQRNYFWGDCKNCFCGSVERCPEASGCGGGGYPL